MLAIRLQRTGRSGHSQFRLIAQDSRFSPKRGRIVAYLGSYNPHTKEVKIDAEKISQYLDNGAQPSESAAMLLRKGGVKLPAWVKQADTKQKSTRNPDKRRSTRPASAEAPADKPAEAKAPAEAPAETETPAAETPSETPAEQPAEPAAVETAEPAVETPPETPAETTAEEPPAEAPAAETEKPAE